MRSLTEVERRKSITAKQAANVVIRIERRKLAGDIAKSSIFHGYSYLDKQRQLHEMKYVTGLPVMLVSPEGETVVVDYEKLRYLTRNLKSKYWSKWFFIKGKLVCEYVHRQDSRRKGVFELFELPKYQRDLLHDLPVIQLSELGA